ncbi:hypothetical protein CROQUDRAFT_667864 [Cronartium quercuum f. sp. fusiforme G11]|uniref:Uncharacterized protein n=1 Tax=Cronartium quercuum f. sp. fusiforme G11 TaxID=708437 RepID=A0A9P6TGC0_9BASI|nr:hypothetical protein CROQUDRAFT_667864 [Cronartium quercuum f. sp. fusiforme G11]
MLFGTGNTNGDKGAPAQDETPFNVAAGGTSPQGSHATSSTGFCIPLPRPSCIGDWGTFADQIKKFGNIVKLKLDCQAVIQKLVEQTEPGKEFVATHVLISHGAAKMMYFGKHLSQWVPPKPLIVCLKSMVCLIHAAPH